MQGSAEIAYEFIYWETVKTLEKQYLAAQFWQGARAEQEGDRHRRSINPQDQASLFPVGRVAPTRWNDL